MLSRAGATRHLLVVAMTVVAMIAPRAACLLARDSELCERSRHVALSYAEGSHASKKILEFAEPAVRHGDGHLDGKAVPSRVVWRKASELCSTPTLAKYLRLLRRESL